MPISAFVLIGQSDSQLKPTNQSVSTVAPNYGSSQTPNRTHVQASLYDCWTKKQIEHPYPRRRGHNILSCCGRSHCPMIVRSAIPIPAISKLLSACRPLNAKVKTLCWPGFDAECWPSHARRGSCGIKPQMSISDVRFQVQNFARISSL